jgi:hypothetical protein
LIISPESRGAGYRSGRGRHPRDEKVKRGGLTGLWVRAVVGDWFTRSGGMSGIAVAPLLAREGGREGWKLQVRGVEMNET